jgi:hypothetical protein
MTLFGHPTVFTVHGDHGELEVHQTGRLVSPLLHNTYDDFIILRFDVAEFLSYYGYKQVPSSVDILDIGYWYMVEGCLEAYEPPESDYRQPKIAITMLRDTAFDIAGLISQTLTNPPKVRYYNPGRLDGLRIAYRDLMQQASGVLK